MIKMTSPLSQMKIIYYIDVVQGGIFYETDVYYTDIIDIVW